MFELKKQIFFIVNKTKIYLSLRILTFFPNNSNNPTDRNEIQIVFFVKKPKYRFFQLSIENSIEIPFVFLFKTKQKQKT